MSRKKDIDFIAPILAGTDEKDEELIRQELGLLSARELRKERKGVEEVFARIGVSLADASAAVEETHKDIQRTLRIVAAGSLPPHSTVQ